MSILVLGGAGYVGSHAVYQLIDQGSDVVVIRMLTFMKVISAAERLCVLFLKKKILKPFCILQPAPLLENR
jgi:UDP-glucose 4-epimerase